jgi:uncharacterized protein YneF (UPF0154 family)
MRIHTRVLLNDKRTPAAGRPGGVIAGILAFVTGAALLVVGLMVSVIFVAIVVALGLAVFGYVWWKTRELRRQMRERPPGGHVIEGEVVRPRE